MPWVDYRHIKASVPIAKVLAHYNIQLKQTAEHHLAGACPIPSHSGDRSNKTAFHVDTQKNVFNCFTHCGGGNILDFVAKMEGCEIRKAAQLLNDWFLVDTSGGTPESAGQGTGESGNKPLTFELQGLKNNHPFLLKEKKLSMSAVKEFGLGFCSKGLLAGWVAIPIHNVKGELVAYAGRAVNSTQAELDGKYKFPPGFQKSVEVFNLFRALEEKEAVKKYGLIIVEGFFGVFHLWECGYKNVAALMGKEMSDSQLKLILDSADRFTLFLDGDEPGREASKKIAGKLSSLAFVRGIEYPDGPKRKPAHFEKEELRALL